MIALNRPLTGSTLATIRARRSARRPRIVPFRLLALLSAVAIGFSQAATTADAELIVAYASSGSSGALAASEFATGVTARALERGPGVTDAGGTTFNTRGWNGTSVESALTLGDRIDWGWDGGPAWDLEWLELLYDRSGTGPQRLAILLSVDRGLNWNTLYTDDAVSPDSNDQPKIALHDYRNVESATFRLVGWNASSAAGTFDFENFTSAPSRAIAVTGSLSPPAAVPEPALAPVLAAAAAALVALKRRRRNASATP